jgi:PAS domain S-box-containing protein
MESTEHVRVLIIEDDEDDYFIARSLLSKTTGISCELEWARDYDAGLRTLSEHDFDVCLVDYRLGPRNGLQLLKEAGEVGVETPMILLTGQGDYAVDVEAMMAGAADYLVKGQIDAQLLERSIRYARERKKAEERIREQARLLDKARDAICAYDLDGRIIYWNKSAERLTGYTFEEMRERGSDISLYDGHRKKVERAWEAVHSEGEWAGDLRQLTKSGDELIVESRWTLVRENSGKPSSVLVINTDVTERKRLEAHFLRAQRMESIGTLVGGIAHDLGNLLVPILLGVKVLSTRFADDEKSMRTLEMIRRSAQRGSDMVKQVLAFARGVEGERIPLNVDQIVREVEKITTETFPSAIDLNVEIVDGLPAIMGDSTQIQQILMNLCVNARDAMPDGGRLDVNSHLVELGEIETRANPEAEHGKYICLQVRDTGTGIPHDVLDKVFEPFFTTKPSGKGTGLGLSSVYSIVKSHGGFVEVDSEEGVGTSFQCYLPVAVEEEGGASALAGDGRQLAEGHGETILLVDDEEFILDSAAETLRDSGFEVLTAEDGREAIDLYFRHTDSIAAVITDVMMPNIDGCETIRRIREHNEAVPIIAASGMAVDRQQEATNAGASAFISKPFSAEKLLSVLQSVLPQDASASQAVEA